MLEKINAKKKLCGDFRPFISQNCQMWDNFFRLLFPRGFRISKNDGHPISGSGGKKAFKRYFKKWTHKQTDRQTDRQTKIWTNRLIESIGPEGRCFEHQTVKETKLGVEISGETTQPFKSPNFGTMHSANAHQGPLPPRCSSAFYYWY